MNAEKHPDIPQFAKYDLVIFDLDGTIYHQKPLRKKMMTSLGINLLTNKIKFRELQIIREFRHQRELHKSYSSPTLVLDQYQWVAEKLKVSSQEVEQVITQWMYEFPLKHLFACRYPGVKNFFRELRRSRKLIAVFSDFPVREKMSVLELEADAYHSSVDKEIQQLKPSGKALEIIMSKFNIPKENTIFIGDREDTDGESARMAGIDFLLVDANKAANGKLFEEWTNSIKSEHEH